MLFWDSFKEVNWARFAISANIKSTMKYLIIKFNFVITKSCIKVKFAHFNF